MRKSLPRAIVYGFCFIFILILLGLAYCLPAFAEELTDTIENITNISLTDTTVNGFDVGFTYNGAADNSIIIVWEGTTHGTLVYSGGPTYDQDANFAGATGLGDYHSMMFNLSKCPDINQTSKNYYIGLYEKNANDLIERYHTVIQIGDGVIIWNSNTIYTYTPPATEPENSDVTPSVDTDSSGEDWIDKQILQIALASGTVNPEVTFDFGEDDYAVPNAVMKALRKYSDVSLRVNMSYNGEKMSMMIPAGTAEDTDIPWYGPLYLRAYYVVIY